MRLTELAALYAVIGVGCAVVRLLARSARDERLVDAGLLLWFWPLFGPFLLMRVEPIEETDPDEGDFIRALERAADSPLGCLLPDRATVRRLGARLRRAQQRLDEITALLSTPQLCEASALARHAELLERGDEQAAATALGRVDKIRTIREMGHRVRRELDQIKELLAQLRIQAEVVRLAGDIDGSTRELTAELLSRIEGMDKALGQFQDTDPQEAAWGHARPS